MSTTKHQTRRTLATIILLAATMQVSAQGLTKLKDNVAGFLTARYQRTNIDTNYVTRPQTRWALVGRLNVSGAELTAKGIDQGLHFESYLEAARKATVSAGVSYMGVSLNLSLNPGKMLGEYRDYELNLRSYGKRFGFDIAYQDARNFKGWHQEEVPQPDGTGTSVERINLPENLLKLRTLNANAYYIFNARRFSYPAAFAHSYLQRRSSGSAMLAVSAQGQHGESQTDAVADESQRLKFKMTNIGIGAGYGYNFVPGKGWLLHISALPTFIVYSNTSLSMGDIDVPLHYHFPEVIITSRGAVVKQLGRNMFAGLSMVYHFTSIGSEDRLTIQNQKWLTRTYFGFRL